MALPTLDATFASSVDLPRRQMLARWLVGELGETQAASNVFVSGAGSSGVNGPYIDAGVFGGKRFYNLQSGGYVIAWDSPNWVIRNIASITLYTSNNNVEFPWQVTTWSAASGSAPVPTVSESPSPSPISNYYDLPERYLWAKIAVAAGGPKTEATYISLPKNYAWSDIYNAVSGDIANSAVVVSGAGTSSSNGTYVKTGFSDGKPVYNVGLNTIGWSSADSYWYIFDDETIGDVVYFSFDDTSYPWEATGWNIESGGASPAPTLTPKTPNHTDWSEKQALGHIAAAYRGDTGTPANLATYIDWPWRYQVASIIGGVGPAFPSAGLLAFWKLADLTDASGNGNSLTNTNDVQFVAGKIGNAAEFNENFLSAAESSNWVLGSNSGNGATVNFWMRRNGNQASEIIGNRNSAIYCPWCLALDPDDTLRFLSYYNGGWAVTGGGAYGSTDIPDLTWVMVTILRTSNLVSVLINGVADNDIIDVPAPDTDTPNDLFIGSGGDGSFLGRIDALGIWNRALTNAEIAQLYSNGNGVEL